MLHGPVRLTIRIGGCRITTMPNSRKEHFTTNWPKPGTARRGKATFDEQQAQVPGLRVEGGPTPRLSWGLHIQAAQKNKMEYC